MRLLNDLLDLFVTFRLSAFIKWFTFRLSAFIK